MFGELLAQEGLQLADIEFSYYTARVSRIALLKLLQSMLYSGSENKATARIWRTP
jgi:hypothetical protein